MLASIISSCVRNLRRVLRFVLRRWRCHRDDGRSIRSRHWDHFGFARPFLINFERGQLHLRLARIGTVHGLAVMAEGFLSESLRVAADLGSFRPGVTIGMQTHPGHLCPAADALELGRPMSRGNGIELWKKRALQWQRPEYLFGFLAEMDHRDRIRLPP